uniref:Aminopeptidase P N-terminal domain-containing protein n=1 Tax=Strigamia maritima TaxID=126957 RepID=T1INK1_STRMM
MASRRSGFILLSFKRNLHNRLSPNENFITKTKSRHYGQPVSSTHPHLISEGQVTPGLRKEEFLQRRTRLMESISKCHGQTNDKMKYDNHIVVIPSATKSYMSEKIPYIFHQNSDFLYTTGFQEPDSVLVLHSHADKTLPRHTSSIFVQKRDPETELWDGPRSGVDGALNLLGVDESQEINSLETYLVKFHESKKRYVLWYDFYNSPNPRIHEIMRKFVDKSFKISCESPRPLLQSLRLIKSNSEIELMKKSCEIASDAFIRVMRFSNEREECNENDLHARMEYECRIRGAKYLAYPPVVAGGNRANIIHYINNNQVIAPNELVLMDAGCYLHGYISDITRTWPVGGKYSSAQKALYQAILEIQEQLLSLCHQRISLDKLHISFTKLLGEKLKELALISSRSTEAEAYQ